MNTDPNKYYAAGMLVNDPTKIINTIPSQTRNTTSLKDPWVNPLKVIEERLTKLETENKFLRLKILSLEGKFTQEEVSNIRKMLMSADSASITLADSIIENA